MAKYAISQEGIDSLNNLANELVITVREIDEACKRLYDYVQAEEDNLGVYAKDLYACIRATIMENKQGKEGVSYMVATAIPQQIATIEELMGMMSGSTDDDDEPPRHKLTLRRHR